MNRMPGPLREFKVSREPQACLCRRLRPMKPKRAQVACVANVSARPELPRDDLA